ncbi:MAG: helix-turn-helix transcriptional regulator [Gammaproteobacteria bacterium]
MDIDAIGRRVRSERKQLGLRQDEFASLVGIGTRFLSELENGKPTLEIGRVLRVLDALGLEVQVHRRSPFPKEQDS